MEEGRNRTSRRGDGPGPGQHRMGMDGVEEEEEAGEAEEEDRAAQDPQEPSDPSGPSCPLVMVGRRPYEALARGACEDERVVAKLQRRQHEPFPTDVAQDVALRAVRVIEGLAPQPRSPTALSELRLARKQIDAEDGREGLHLLQLPEALLSGGGRAQGGEGGMEKE